ncbi:MAG TPA: UDP-3-O-(3-hydroxymyristoyl)glucosamine N-acyltransferase [Ignavibacteria bacterium]|nr:UDP-3-O-(3-hydroxymyristoyl)glucosamine N-acyltransferase [Ignavibacteria bacterium]HMQ99196.1 UDP-3-O-(3-hydroxymyristoyl)glucosamine N-acyltransferase [Ignavibacteria bacterium]
MKLHEIAELLSGELSDPDFSGKEISGIGKIEQAGEDEITFIANPVYEKYFSGTSAGCVIVSKKFNPVLYQRLDDRRVPLIRVEDPYLSFLTLLDILSPQTELQKVGIAETAVISETAEISNDDVRIGAHCFIGEKVTVGARVSVLPNTVIMAGSEISDDVLIYPNVTIYQGTKIGKRVIIHSGTVIGSDGFGQAKNPDGTFQKIPQKGIVVIEDDVEIGSNCTIDRATMGETIIRRGVKLDNMIQIAHNVEIGENTVIAAQSGVAGSTKIGKNCMIGGKVGIVGHISICDNVILTAATNVSKSINEPGMYSGYRSQPMRAELRQEAVIRALNKKVK